MQFEWLNNNYFVATKQVKGRYDLLTAHATYWFNGNLGVVHSASDDYVAPIYYAYDEQSGMLATVTETYRDPTITVVEVFSERQLIGEGSSIPFSTEFKLDSPVVDVEWMPSFFHYD